MWPLFLDRSVTLTKRMHGSVSQVHEILLNPQSFTLLHPFVTKVEQDPTNPQRYKIFERIPGPGHIWERDNSMHAIFTPREDGGVQGVDVAVTLPQSFLLPKLINKYRIKDTEEPGTVEVLETVELRALFLLVPYILSTLTKAHKETLDRLAEVVEHPNRAG